MIVFAQNKKSFPVCDDKHEKFTAIYNSFDKLLGSYKKKETGKEKNKIFYSSEFNLCGLDGVLTEEKYSSATEVVLSFRFKSSDYMASAKDLKSWGELLMQVLADVFGKWEFEQSSSSDAESNSKFYSFSEGKVIKGGKTKEVRFHIFEIDDVDAYVALSLEFKFNQY